MKNFFKPVVFIAALFFVLTSGATKVFAAPTLSTSETVANVAEVKAVRTLTVASAVASSTAGTAAKTILIGNCTITFATTTSGTARVGASTLTRDELDCGDGAAIILLATTTADIANSVASTSLELRGLKNVSDTNHGNLAVSGSGSDIIFTATSTETSETNIAFTDGTGGKITSGTPTTAVAAVAQVVVFTPTGAVDYIYTITINGTDYAYTHRRGELKDLVENIKAGLPTTPVTCTEDDAAITCTAVTAGTAFTYSTSITSSPTASGSSSSGTSSRSGGGGGGGYTTPVAAKVVTTISGGLTAEQVQSIKNQISGLLQLITRLQQKLLRIRGY